ncbi:BREX-3 system phosphatase PglZ [Sediminispirochaeta bajacaliforniensis]|uniref:BREX-3 system phosphatase PglZ n=1 Tax=Sediminispirochaeta bajacaliforniensis TaxID=148 RepID=UPI00036A7BB7|nr:BREX-3 system phosphatase PglZ [Sediminispirochaeta bajacaliforniensis]
MISLEDKIKEAFSIDLIGTIPLSIIKTSQTVIDTFDISGFLTHRGYTVLHNDQYLQFRCTYETLYRQRLETGDLEGFSLVIITTDSLDQLDFDILEQAEREYRVFDYSFSQVFPPEISAIENLLSQVPKEADEWINFAQELGILLYQFRKSDKTQKYGSLLIQLLNKSNAAFSKWCDSHYSLMLNASYINPKTLNNILPYLAYKRRKKDIDKVALLVFDGMSFDQWEIIKREITNLTTDLIEENGIFAMIPTLTSVSRQAIFSGKLPKDYSQSINTTQKEKDFWEKFWAEEKHQSIKFIKPKEDFQEQIEELKASIKDNRIKIIGTTFLIVDELMHKMSQGYSQMYNSIVLWLRQGYFKDTIKELMENDFDIYITADHGNIEALPGRKLNEGILVDTKGQRVRIYDRESAREKAMSNYEELIKIESEKYALPDNYYAVAQSNAEYFGKAGPVITHGGLSVQEVLVPFIHIKKEQK